SLMMVRAISSRVQPLAGRSCSAVLLLAVAMTAIWVWGGKAPGSAGARGVLESSQAMLDEALTPHSDGVAVATQGRGDVLVGRVVVSGGAQDDGCGSARQEPGAW